jgi:hypothetical protein
MPRALSAINPLGKVRRKRGRRWFVSRDDVRSRVGERRARTGRENLARAGKIGRNCLKVHNSGTIISRIVVAIVNTAIEQIERCKIRIQRRKKENEKLTATRNHCPILSSQPEGRFPLSRAADLSIK